MDINKVWLSGVAVSEPVMTYTGSTPISYFNLQVNEHFKDRSGASQMKPNIIRIEALGKHASKVKETVCAGKRFIVDGYIRIDSSDGQDFFRVRAFAVNEDNSLDHQNYKEGLRQALKAVKSSKDIDSAVERLKSLLV